MLNAPIHVGPIEFAQPVWLALAPALCVVALVIARTTLTGMSTLSRRVALGVRLLVIFLLVAALARPNWRREAEHVAVTVIMDQSRSIPLGDQARAEEWLRAARVGSRPGDEIGRVAVAREAYVQAIPGPVVPFEPAQQQIDRDGTNLAEGLRLAMAVMPDDFANRVLYVSDGNENIGSILAAAEAARAAGVRVDVLPVRYTYEHEVIVERLVGPATARMGENVNLRVILNATRPTVGRVNILINGEPIDLDPDSPALGMYVKLDAGVNPLTVPVTLRRAGAQRFEVIFEPLPDESGQIGDTVGENNHSSSVTFVSSEGRVLVLASGPEEAAPLLKALEDSKIGAEFRAADQAPATLVELGIYDAVILIDTPSYDLSVQQQEDLRAYVHDLGGGLVMIGGPESFGAGGWIGSPLADALPVKLDPPQKRQMPKGALVLMMHACEAPQGNYWGVQTALAAVDALSAQDLAGVVEYQYGAGGASWVHKLSPLGDKSSIKRDIKNMNHGDAPSFDDFMRLAIPALEKSDAGQKHAILISDGDPALPAQDLMKRYINAKISVSTVLVFPHTPSGMGPEATNMKLIADKTGGKFYAVTQNNQLQNLPKIFIKEAQTVRRSLIWEGGPFTPAFVNSASEPMRGLGSAFPPIRGYVVTAEREGLAQVSLRGMENDPILASWQYGLGKSIAFTSDAAARWGPGWVAWGKYRQFWEQHVRWAMRPTGNANVRVQTEDQGGRTRVVVDALDPKGDPLNFARFLGRVVGPDGQAGGIDLRQIGPGRYEGSFPSDKSGAYVLNLRYNAPDPDGGGKMEGNIQAAVTRPFADEFRSLEDNTALLKQVAAITGGRVLGGDPARAGLWDRAGLTMPVARKPIWLAVAVLAIALFLTDVAVRRVRIDIPAMARAARGAIARRKGAAGAELGSLKEARERAKQGMAKRTADRSAAAADTAQAAVQAVDKASRAVKFEATPEELARSRTADTGAAKLDPAARAPAPGEDPAKKKTPEQAQEEGISRLLKAKKRARDEMEE